MDDGARAVLSVARSVLEDLDVDVVLERVLESARDLTGAQYAALGVLDESRTALARFLTLGIDETARREIGVLPRGRGVLGVLITHPVPLRLADVGATRAPTGSRSATPRWAPSWGRRFSSLESRTGTCI
jgi:hypothetical protein